MIELSQNMDNSFQTLQQFDMKNQLLKIDFKQDKGLMLLWNYSNVPRYDKYFRHLIALSSDDVDQNKKFLTEYIKYTKPGDLYSTIYKPYGGEVKSLKWRQMTCQKDFSIENYLKDQKTSSFSLDKIFDYIINQINKYKEPMMIVLFQMDADKIKEMVDRFLKQRVQISKMFIVNFFNKDVCNSISVTRGINVFCLTQPKIVKLFHRRYLSQIAVEYSVVTITSLNGQLNASEQQEWRNVDFNKIQRKCWGPSIKYDVDVVNFYNPKQRGLGGSYQLTVDLFYKQFDGNCYTTRKTIKVNFEHNLCFMSVPTNYRERCTNQRFEVQLLQNPYFSLSLINFEDQIDKNMIKNDDLF